MMSTRTAWLAGLLLAPLLAAASKDLSGAAWMAQVPAMPADAQAAYALWQETPDGALQRGAVLQALEDDMSGYSKDAGAAAAAANNPQQQAQAQALAQQYGSPEAQARLRAMSPAELMAMGQQINAQMMPAQNTYVGPVSEADGKATRVMADALMADARLQPQVIAFNSGSRVPLLQKWDAENAAIDQQQQAAFAALPICRGEAGEPSGRDIATVQVRFATQRVEAASRYLGQAQALDQQLRAILRPAVDAADAGRVAWAGIQNPPFKQSRAQQAQNLDRLGPAHAALAAGLVEDFSRKAADQVETLKKDQRQLAQAQGC
jgi:hypothetical protein